MVDRIVIFLCLLGCALIVAGCEGAVDTSKTAGNSAESERSARMEQARSSLLERDLAFGNAVTERGLAEAYRTFLAADAVQLPDGDRPLWGKEAIYAQIQDATQDLSQATDFALSWKPEAAEVSESGDLGYTLGTYWLELNDEDGEPMLIEGNYVNVWRKSPDGVWEVIVDISNQISADYAVTGETNPDEPLAD